MVGPSPAFANADYLFPEEGVVAELKCMQKDVVKGQAYETQISAALERWIGSGRISPFAGRVRIHSAQLPDDCRKELFNILRRPLHAAIKKANQQIKETRANLNLANAKGLLLLANDGCWSLEVDGMLYLLDISLGDRFKGINSVVFFTVNMPAQLPGINKDVLVWAPGHRKGIDPVTDDFLGRLQRGWAAYYQALIGHPVPVFEQDHHSISDLRFVRRQPCSPQSQSQGDVWPSLSFEAGRFYTDDLGAKFRCIGLHGQTVTLLRFEIHQGGNLYDAVFTQDLKH